MSPEAQQCLQVARRRHRRRAAAACRRCLPAAPSLHHCHVAPRTPPSRRLYKQATAGPCTTPKPSFFDRKGRAKWAAWQQCSELSSSQAQNKYVQLLTQLIPDWAGAAGSGDSSGGGRKGGAGGPVQSRMAEAAEDEVGCWGRCWQGRPAVYTSPKQLPSPMCLPLHCPTRPLALQAADAADAPPLMQAARIELGLDA